MSKCIMASSRRSMGISSSGSDEDGSLPESELAFIGADIAKYRFGYEDNVGSEDDLG